MGEGFGVPTFGRGLPSGRLPHRQEEAVLVRCGPEQGNALAGDLDEEGGRVVAEVDAEGTGCELVEPRGVAEQALCEIVRWGQGEAAWLRFGL